MFSHFSVIVKKVWGGSPTVKSISIGIDTSRGTSDEGIEETDAEEEGNLNLSGEKIEETAQVSDIGTTVLMLALLIFQI